MILIKMDVDCGWPGTQGILWFKSTPPKTYIQVNISIYIYFTLWIIVVILHTHYFFASAEYKVINGCTKLNENHDFEGVFDEVNVLWKRGLRRLRASKYAKIFKFNRPRRKAICKQYAKGRVLRFTPLSSGSWLPLSTNAGLHSAFTSDTCVA